MDVDDRLESEAQIFISQVKQRYKKNSPTYRRFKFLLRQITNPSYKNEINVERLLSEVRAIFSDNIYLIHKFKRFLPAKTPSKPAGRRKTLSGPPKLDLGSAVKFINNARATVKDYAVFLVIVKVLMDYRKHSMSADWGFKRDALLFLKEYPALQIQLTEILDNEDDMYHADRLFHQMLSTKEAAERLIEENQNAGLREGQTRERMEEEIDVSDYFSALDFRCVQDQLGDSAVLPGRLMSRGIAVEDSMEIVSRLDNMIRESAAERYTEEELEKLKAMADRGKEVEEWDWHSELSEDMYINNPVQLYSKSSSTRKRPIKRPSY